MAERGNPGFRRACGVPDPGQRVEQVASRRREVLFLARVHRGMTPSQSATASLADLGISKTQSSRWQKLAAIPDRDFEATFGNGQRQATAGLIAAHAPPSKTLIIPVDPNALWLWGRLLDFERDG